MTGPLAAAAQTPSALAVPALAAPVGLLAVARAAAAVNLLVLAALGAVWLRNYRSHGAKHTLGLLVFAALLLVENALWLYFYLLHPGFIGWFEAAGPDVRVGVTLLCGIELVALAFLARITLQ